MNGDVLIVEDEKNLLELMTDMLSEVSLSVQGVGTLDDARRRLTEHQPDLLILDLKLPDGDGLSLLQEVRDQGMQMPAIIVTAFGTVEKAAAAMRTGASDFVVKPFDNDRFQSAVFRALELGREQTEVELSAPRVDADQIVGRGLDNLVAILDRVAQTEATVLVRGETGTGKELIARAIHRRSPRRDGPFISINCSAIAPTLIESELFGFERGAFTGAHAQKKGLIESAAAGTLFLDEIGDMPLEAQAKVLRVLQEKEIMRVGGRSPVPVDVRVVAATHQDLEAMTSAGTFRSDLLYRLNVVPIALPPLRERPQDIPGLVEHFLAQQAERHRVAAPRLTPADLARLSKKTWPGNVRELQNFIERAVVLGSFEPVAQSAPVEPPDPAPATSVKPLRRAVAEAERAAVIAALQASGGNKAEAARLLGVSYKTLFNKINDHGIKEQRSIG